MFGGGGGLNPRKMQKMMEQMGIEMEELDAERVVITLSGGDELVFSDADVTMMEARGQETYQVIGEAETRTAAESGGDDAALPDGDSGAGIPDDDIDLVSERTGASRTAAEDALEEADGDLAAAISRLS